MLWDMPPSYGKTQLNLIYQLNTKWTYTYRSVRFKQSQLLVVSSGISENMLML